MDYRDYIADSLLKLDELSGFSQEELTALLEVPPQPEMGDFAFPCFKFAKVLKKSPQVIAEQLAQRISGLPHFTRIVNNGPYLNFFVDVTDFVASTLGEIQKKGNAYLTSEKGAGKTIVIDYSSPNISKSMHIGHLSSTVVGKCLYNVCKALGFKVVGVNHLGDWGTYFGKMIVAYKRFGNREMIDERGVAGMNEIYLLYSNAAKEDASLNDEARAWFVKLQNGDTEAVELWQWFLSVSIKECERLYEILGVKFDAFTGESFYNDKMPAVVEEIREKGLLVESDGAMIVDLSKKKMPPCLILRSDGGTLYPTRDISCAIYRKQTYDFHKCLYVTGAEQVLHFAQWFAVIEYMGYDWAKDLIHVPLGMILSADGGKFATRSGNAPLLSDMLDEAIERTMQIIEEKNPDLEDKAIVARQVGIGALTFSSLYNSRIKDNVFNWDNVLSYEGESGPYIQYTHARCVSVLERSGGYDAANVDFKAVSDNITFEIAKLAANLPDKLTECYDKLEPYVISRHLIAISQAFNRFYHDNPILSADETTRNARLAVVDTVRLLLSEGLSLLGIEAPKRM